MQLYVAGYQSNIVLRFLRNFFVTTPLQVWFRFITALWPSSVPFVNYTGATDVQLQQCWLAAQQNLSSSPFPLNTAGGDLHVADKRARTVQPKHVTVVAVPDTPVSDLVKFDPAWSQDKDPSGAILLEANNGFLGYTPCHSFACCWIKPRVYAAASKIPVTLQYEFENIILSELGYNTDSR